MRHQNRGIAAKVFQWLEQRPGLVCYSEDIAQGLDVEKAVINNAINWLKNGKNLPIETVLPGSAWRYDPNKQPQKKTVHSLFELVGKAKNGDLILQDEEGGLFRAKEID